jgi:pimeloyl-ACP methyl ester carboxylesterase
MPFVSNRGQRIHYTVEGEGPLVIFQHGMLSSAADWKQAGFVDALTDKYRVACVDSLAHGLSDKPTDRGVYDQAERAGDLVAVMDALGAGRAHLIGYSMGSWMCIGVAKYHPARVASLVVGGWGLVDGVRTLPPTRSGHLSPDQLLKFARRHAPALVEWVTPDVELGLRAAWDALSELDGAADAVLGLPVPVLLWDGREDGYHDPMRAFAAAHGLPFLSTPGNHLGAMSPHGAVAARGIRDFLDGVSGCPAGRRS